MNNLFDMFCLLYNFFKYSVLNPVLNPGVFPVLLTKIYFYNFLNFLNYPTLTPLKNLKINELE